ncbi:Ras-related protein Rab-3C [Mytilus galloprovincialis]|uniref:Ras-related protein Rab-3C n=1 Tax=Mytilus galloprovincialis TaxID=29158 RepID=A0A8B6FZN1_MYTGA|nr:Ras-related protein Rab-3C [Mytilus galloprovincialis]
MHNNCRKFHWSPTDTFELFAFTKIVDWQTEEQRLTLNVVIRLISATVCRYYGIIYMYRYFTYKRCTQIKTYSWDNAQVVLVGNKCDLEDERVVSMERGKQLADQLGLEFFETSAKENINVKAVFERLVDIICDKMSESLDSDPSLVNSQAKGTRLTENPNPQNSGCQC